MLMRYAVQRRTRNCTKTTLHCQSLQSQVSSVGAAMLKGMQAHNRSPIKRRSCPLIKIDQAPVQQSRDANRGTQLAMEQRPKVALRRPRKARRRSQSSLGSNDCLCYANSIVFL